MRDTRAEVERMLDQSSAEFQALSAVREDDDEAAFAAYDHATLKRFALYLRAVAAELDQMHPETDSHSERAQCASGCLRKLRESEWMLESISDRP